ncbi:hypothetical protein KAU11_08630, partial [Candidatus Babeliales bacterium]|nr:hypothetical protein [Candidatus Babeliales bacterium]
RDFPSLHQYAMSSEVSYEPRKVFYIRTITDKIKYPDVWTCTYMRIASSIKYRQYMKSIRKYVIDNQDLIAFMEL